MIIHQSKYLLNKIQNRLAFPNKQHRILYLLIFCRISNQSYILVVAVEIRIKQMEILIWETLVDSLSSNESMNKETLEVNKGKAHKFYRFFPWKEFFYKIHYSSQKALYRYFLRAHKFRLNLSGDSKGLRRKIPSDIGKWYIPCLK